jgi:DNA polymerase-3 subunit gamma/tau
MPSISFATQYRPLTFEDCVGQPAILQVLKNSLRQNRIAPAYLFCGTRGTGKTTTARIFAMALNCLKSDRPVEQPCGHCQSCQTILRGSSLDVFELDAASNSSVVDVRELIEQARYATASARYRIFIIDECHALSNAAVQALLKTLEEPPAHTVFLLCTTEPDKLGSTIISRCLRLNFCALTCEQMLPRLRYIAQSEEIEASDAALNVIVSYAKGGMRDAISLLQQVSLFDEIDETCVCDLLGIVPEDAIDEIIDLLLMGNKQQLKLLVDKLFEMGKNPTQILYQILDSLYDLAAMNRVSSQWIQIIIDGESTIKSSRQPQLLLQSLLLQLT